MYRYICIILLASFILPIKLTANGYEPPPIITEIYFDENDEWTLEFYIEENYYSGLVNLDSLKINSAIIEDQIIVEFGVPLLITSDMLIGDLDITRESGSLYVFTHIYDYWTELDWGVHWGGLNPALPGQSLAVLFCFNYNFYPVYNLVHNYPPSLGYNMYNATGKGIWQGYIFDINGTPIPDVEFECDIYNSCPVFFSSDSNGFFSGLFYAGIHYINYFRDEEPNFYGSFTTEWVEIDSTVYCEIIAPVYLTEIKKFEENILDVYTFPNPTKELVNFKIIISNEQDFKTGKIVISDLSGKMIENIYIDCQENSSITYEIHWIPPEDVNGILIYSIFLDNNMVTSDKIIVSK